MIPKVWILICRLEKGRDTILSVMWWPFKPSQERVVVALTNSGGILNPEFAAGKLLAGERVENFDARFSLVEVEQGEDFTKCP